MKILILRPNYYPEVAGGTRLAKDLVDDLIRDGHHVELLTPFPTKAENVEGVRLQPKKNELSENGSLVIKRIHIPIKETNIITRIFKSFFLCVAMFIRGMRSKDVDLIMTISMPPFIGPIGNVIGKLKKIPVVYWEQDIISNSIKQDSKFGNKLVRIALKKIIRLLEKFSIKYSTHIITISNKFKEFHTLEERVDSNKITTIYNWIDTTQVNYLNRDNNILFNKLNLDKNKFYVTYCGNIGYPHNLETLIDTAKLLERYKDIHFLIIGDGSRKRAIENYIEEVKPSNVSIHPLVPLDQASQAYSIGDASIVIGQKGTSENGFPSKTWSIMSAQRPVVSSFDLDSELTSILLDNDCGIPVEPENSVKLKEAILKLYNDRTLIDEMGSNGLNYVKNHISREETTKSIIKLFERLHNQEV